jgi:hypothetical protein
LKERQKKREKGKRIMGKLAKKESDRMAEGRRRVLSN